MAVIPDMQGVKPVTLRYFCYWPFPSFHRGKALHIFCMRILSFHPLLVLLLVSVHFNPLLLLGLVPMHVVLLVNTVRTLSCCPKISLQSCPVLKPFCSCVSFGEWVHKLLLSSFCDWQKGDKALKLHGNLGCRSCCSQAHFHLAIVHQCCTVSGTTLVEKRKSIDRVRDICSRHDTLQLPGREALRNIMSLLSSLQPRYFPQPVPNCYTESEQAFKITSLAPTYLYWGPRAAPQPHRCVHCIHLHNNAHATPHVAEQTQQPHCSKSFKVWAVL